jgi:hypothetical protein
LNNQTIMSTRSSFQNTPPEKKGLLIRFLLVLLASVFCALGFTSMTGREELFEVTHLAVNLAAAAGIGLVTGFFVRLLLANWNAFLRVIISLTGILSGLLILGGMTGWQYGIGPMSFSRPNTDWFGLGLVLLGSFSALVTGLAYRDSAQRQSVVNQSSAGGIRPVGRQASTAVESTAIRSRAIPAKSRATPRRSGEKTRKNLDVKAKNGSAKKKKSAGSIRQKTQTTHPAIKRRPAKKIVLAPVEEHRCPYCLEPVKRNDPRGVVECSICHTLHHADCWAITGTCQVPHYNH